jgi:general secretion pathway protein H
MVRRAALEPLPTFQAIRRVRRPTRCIDESSRQDGYILLEIVCVLAIIGLLAAIILPAIPRATSRARLEGYAVATAAVLKADRVAALRQRVRVETIVNAEARTIRSGSGGRIVQLPADVQLDAMLAARCYDRLTGMTIDFFPSGMSCGGVIALTHLGVGYEVRVNWLTGGVDVVPHRPLWHSPPRGTAGFTLIEVLVDLRERIAGMDGLAFCEVDADELSLNPAAHAHHVVGDEGADAGQLWFLEATDWNSGNPCDSLLTRGCRKLNFYDHREASGGSIMANPAGQSI